MSRTQRHSLDTSFLLTRRHLPSYSIDLLVGADDEIRWKYFMTSSLIMILTNYALAHLASQLASNWLVGILVETSLYRALASYNFTQEEW